MLIKQPSLNHHLGKNNYPIYILTGQDSYLLETSALQIKNFHRQQTTFDEKVIDVVNASDWNTIIEEANNYSLFAENVFLDCRFEKKSLDESSKKILASYLKQINSRCIILLRAPNIATKQLQWLSNNNDILIIQCAPLPSSQLIDWIAQKIKEANIKYQPGIPELIHQYTQGNMLACAQTIEKLKLSPARELLTVESLKEQLADQCEFQPYELTEACLRGNTAQALHILRWASKNKTEPTLLLWLLTQEVRLLIELHYLVNAAVEFKAACAQLKIWPQRQMNYQRMIGKHSLAQLCLLLEFCKSIDEQIKTSQGVLIWINLEKLVLAL